MLFPEHRDLQPSWNFVYCFSTTKGHVSYLTPNGSIFIQQLTKLLNENNSTFDFIASFFHVTKRCHDILIKGRQGMRHGEQLPYMTQCIINGPLTLTREITRGPLHQFRIYQPIYLSEVADV